MNGWTDLNALGARQYGAVSLEQAVELGVSPVTLRRRATAEGWQRPFPGIFLLAGSADSALRTHSAAMLAVGGAVALARESAAWLSGASDPAPHHVELIIPATRRAPMLSGVKVIRSRTIDHTQVEAVRGLPVTTMARTIVDLAAVHDIDALRGLLIKARQRRKVGLDEVLLLLDRLGSAPGASRLRHVLGQLDVEVVDSVLERLVRQLLRRHGLVPYPAPYPLILDDGRTVHLDIAFPEYLIWIEVDGFSGHSKPEQLDVSDRRQNAICALGWSPIRVTWLRYQNDKAGIIEDVCRQISRRRQTVSAHRVR